MNRLSCYMTRTLLAFALALAAIAHGESRPEGREHERFELVETTIADIQHAYRSELLTPEQLVKMYQARIAAFDRAGPHLNGYMYVNPNATEAAQELMRKSEDRGDDREDRDSLPLYGVPVILKDNIATAGMPTTAGSVALGNSIPSNDAFIAARLRRAGAIILGKGTLTEFANFFALANPSGYSSQLRFQLFEQGGDIARVGYGFNPFDPRPDPRPDVINDGIRLTRRDDGRPALDTGGSSSGPAIAVSANLAAVGVGTETSGSILSPSSANLLVGIKPTLGLVSRTGIVPITADQDTAGPIARTVTDAAKLLGVLAGYDPTDPATIACLTPGKCLKDYTRFLNKKALKGARIAVPHLRYWTNSLGQIVISAEIQKVMADAIAVLRAQGAIVDDPADIPDAQEVNNVGTCVVSPPFPATCSTVLVYGFKRDLNAYLADFGPAIGADGKTVVSSLADVIAFNNAFVAGGENVGLKYGQDILLAAQALDTRADSSDTARYHADRARDIDLARSKGLDVMYQKYDAVLFPANRGAAIAARAGYPSIVVPGGFIANPAVSPPPLTPPTPFPAGFNAEPAPYGVTFSGPPFSEPRLIGYAYAFEQATRIRQPPTSAPPLASDFVEHEHGRD
jgi:amidase